MQKTKGDGMTGPTRISDILDHLAWLRVDIHKVRGETDGRQVLKNVLFVYNAATLFEWYVTISRPDTAEFPYRTRDQVPAKRRANRFVMKIAKSVDQIQKARVAPGTKKAKSIPTYVAAVEEALDGFLNSLPTAFSAGIRPVRIPELEMPVNPRELLAQQVSEIPVPGVCAGPADGGDHKATDPLSPLMQVLGIIFALEELKTTGVDGGRKRRRGDRVAAVQNGGAQPCRSLRGEDRGDSPDHTPFQREAQECIATWRCGARYGVRC